MGDLVGPLNDMLGIVAMLRAVLTQTHDAVFDTTIFDLFLI